MTRHDVALLLAGAFGMVFVLVVAVAVVVAVRVEVARSRARRRGLLVFDTPKARERIGRPW